MDSQNGEDFLSHYGVLGMHWGERKDEPSSSRTKKASNTPKSKPKTVSKTADTEMSAGEVALLSAGTIIAYAGTYTAVTLGREGLTDLAGKIAAPAYLGSVVKDVANIKKHTDKIDVGKDFANDIKDTKISAGTTFHRVASYKEAEVNAPKYATYLKDDVLRYRNSWVTPGRSATDPHFATRLTATKNVKIASPNSIAKTLINAFERGDAEGKALWDAYLKSRRYGAPSLDSISAVDRADMIIGHNRLHVWGDDVGTVTSKMMQKAGYAAVTDINNTGYGSRKHAVILLDKAAFTVTSARLRAGERQAALLVKSKFATKLVAKAVSKL